MWAWAMRDSNVPSLFPGISDVAELMKGRRDSPKAYMAGFADGFDDNDSKVVYDSLPKHEQNEYTVGQSDGIWCREAVLNNPECTLTGDSSE